MTNNYRTLTWIVLVGTLLTQFNNCGGYSSTDVSTASGLTSLDCDADCISQASDNLEVKVNLGSNGVEYSVPAGLSEFNLGGDCNEGGYASSVIYWELSQNGIIVRTSNMPGVVIGGGVANSKCVNGRFSLYINLSNVSPDPVNRTGLMTGSGTARGPYDLYIEIKGLTESSAQVKGSTIKSRTRVSLLPI